MLLAAAKQSRSIWRLAFAGILLPTIMAGVDHVLFTSLASGWRLDMWLTALTMAVLVLQIGIMGVICGGWINWPLMSWLLYAWSWLLVDMQALLVRQLAVENIFGRNAAFLTGSLFAAQLSLVLVWAILGRTRWSTRWPLALVLGTVVSIPLLELGYSAGNVAPFLLTQLVTTGGICALLRWKHFELTMRRNSTEQVGDSMPADDLYESQFGLRHMLVWTTALALVLSLLRLVGLPWDQWTDQQFLRDWLVFVSSGVAMGIVLVVVIWSALGSTGRAHRWSLVLLVTPVAAIASGMVEWLLWISQPRIWALWGGQLDWRGWQFWREFFYQERWLIAWICLAGAMLFVTLLFLRSQGYRLRKRTAPKDTET